MWQKLKAVFSSIPTIAVSKRNFLMISADIKKGTVIVSYKGKIKYGYFSDSTLRNLVKPQLFDRGAKDFLIAVGNLINQIINE